MGCVLVVDDDTAIRSLVETVLVDEGYEVLTAENGQHALEVLERVRPEIILLDIFMPVMNGTEFAAAYRQRPGPHAPIVVITAGFDGVQKARDIAADGLVTKPFDLDELLHAIELHAPRVS
jgi:CheY-like chemotaxis protein